MRWTFRLGIVPAALSAAGLAALPASAAPVPPVVQQPLSHDWSDAAQTVERHSRHRHHPHRGYRNRTSVGDVIAGAVVLGTIAAIVSSAKRERRSEQDWRNRDWDDRSRPSDDRYDARGLDGAADQCVREIERDVRVRGVDTVERDAAGWLVRGTVYDGAAFTCSIGQDGRIEDITYDGATRGALSDGDGQWSEERYRAARDEVGEIAPERRDDAADVPGDEGPQPAYPGGPLPGEDEADYSESDDGLALAP